MICGTCGRADTMLGLVLERWVALCWDEATLTLHETPLLKRKTPAVLADETGVGTEEQCSLIYTTAPDPDGWSTHDQLEWLDTYA